MQADRVVELASAGQIKAAERSAFGTGIQQYIKARTGLQRVIEMTDQRVINANTAFTRTVESAHSAIVTFALCAVLLAVLLGYCIAMSVVRPLAQLSAAADRLAVGDVTIEIDSSAKDEVGDLSRSLAAVVVNTRDQATTLDGSPRAIWTSISSHGRSRTCWDKACLPW